MTVAGGGNDAVRLRAAGLRKSYPAPGGELAVLDGIDLELEGGQSLAVTGPSGSGKSTLLHILGALERPSSGRLELGCPGCETVDVLALGPRELARFRNRQVGFVFQDHHLLPQLSALENVLVPTLVRGAPGRELDPEPWARALLERMGLGDRLDHRPAELSGGERQRVAIARALVTRPLLVLCDEPTGNLDAASAAGVADLLLELHRELGSILVVVTHSSELAGRLGRRAELRAGRLAEP
ncbi:MAG: ABC transporter ATP-binding protein [Planctomycetes bacterium]|nr:ABC transporter ATP-binding protein [Planctomycetota bacterium]